MLALVLVLVRMLSPMLLRALGPSVPVSGVLSDTVLTLYDSTGQLITMNDNWRSNSNAPEIEATGLAPRNDPESALLTSLAPGAYTAQVSGVDGSVMFSAAIAPAPYTAIVRGVNGTTGIALVEVYALN